MHCRWSLNNSKGRSCMLNSHATQHRIMRSRVHTNFTQSACTYGKWGLNRGLDVCTKGSHWSQHASSKGKAEHRLHALSARRRRQMTTLGRMLTSEADFLRSEGCTACPRRMVMPGAHEVGEEVMFTAWNCSSSTRPAFAPAARSAAKAVSQW